MKARVVHLISLALAVMFSQTALSQGGVDVNAFLRETQQTDQRNGKTVLAWFVPPDFWEQSAISTGVSPAAAKSAFAPLRDYQLFIVGVGSVGTGNIDWLSRGGCPQERAPSRPGRP